MRYPSRCRPPSGTDGRPTRHPRLSRLTAQRASEATSVPWQRTSSSSVLGVMGSATVDALARQGHSVVGIERYPQGHALGSSHGPTRIIRRSIEEGPAYVPIVLDAFERWHDLQDDANRPIIELSGVIRIAPVGSIAAHRLPHERRDVGPSLRDARPRQHRRAVSWVRRARRLRRSLRSGRRFRARRRRGEGVPGPSRTQRGSAALRGTDAQLVRRPTRRHRHHSRRLPRRRRAWS